MLGIGVAMVASLTNYHRLVIHRHLGALILIVVVSRLINRHYSRMPPFPATMSAQERSLASASELVLYALLFLLPLVGWGMLSPNRTTGIDTSSPRYFHIASGCMRFCGELTRFGVPNIPYIPSPPGGCPVSYAGRARRNVQPYGAV